MLPKAKHTVIFVGYQALGTRGRNLVSGATEVKMHGEMVPVRAQIASIQSFSVHADADELIAWMNTQTEAPGQVLVVHGEAGVAEVFSDRIKSQLGWKSHAPHDGEIVHL
jgi:metallo-beta-lactamase family protein